MPERQGRRQVGGPARAAGGVEGREFAHEDVDRPAVADDVVRGEHEHVPIRRAGDEPAPHERAGHQVEGRPGVRGEEFGERGLAGRARR